MIYIPSILISTGMFLFGIWYTFLTDEPMDDREFTGMIFFLSITLSATIASWTLFIRWLRSRF